MPPYAAFRRDEEVGGAVAELERPDHPNAQYSPGILPRRVPKRNLPLRWHLSDQALREEEEAEP